MSYVYIQSQQAGASVVRGFPEHGTFEHDLFTVGFYGYQGRFEPESDHSTREAAAARVAYLNGGNNDNREQTTSAH